MWEKRYENRRLKAVAFCVLLAVSTMLPSTDALKTKSRSKSSSSSSSSGRVSKPSSTSYSNPGSLSYSNYQSKPAPKPAPKPSAPVDTSNQRNIGWNVNNQAKPAGSVAQPAVNKPPPYPVQSNAAKPPYPVQSNAGKPPYPVQQHSNTHQTHAAPGGPPPPYSHGPPPPYSAANNPNMNSRFNEPPPMYSPGNQGFRPGQPGFGQPGSYGQPGFGQPGSFGQPMGGYGGAGGYHPQGAGFGAPHGTFQGGGYAPPVNYAPQPSFPIAAIPVGAYKPQSSGLGVGGIAAGIGTGLLAGAAGSALYNALRPEDRGRYREGPGGGGVTIINNVPAAAGAAPVEGAAPAMAAVPVQTSPGVAAAAPAPNSPPASGAADGSSNVPLAPMPGSSDNANPNAPNVPVQTDPMETTTVDPNAKQYIPPPGQYYPATGQYVPPGEYDPATGIFTPGRYIAETNIFQSGLYDPLSQMFTPGRYDTTGQFIADPDNPPLSLAPNSGAAPAAQPETVTPAVASQFKTTSGANMPPISNLLVALDAFECKKFGALNYAPREESHMIAPLQKGRPFPP
uniref:Uncharacterized protein n=1 Tax=Anopheles coluzzii TaxID=1518534 RepID=A0A8W7PKY5_ANOCL